MKEKDEEIRKYEEWVEELQAAIKDLEGQGEEASERPTEESDEEVADGNNV